MGEQLTTQDTPVSLPPSETPSYTRMTDDERERILTLRDGGLTLTQIAEHVNRSVSTVHDIISRYRPSVDLAKRKLAAAADRMAENVIEHGLPRDHVKVLEGLGVLQSQDRDINIAVGISLPGMTFAPKE